MLNGMKVALCVVALAMTAYAGPASGQRPYGINEEVPAPQLMPARPTQALPPRSDIYCDNLREMVERVAMDPQLVTFGSDEAHWTALMAGTDLCRPQRFEQGAALLLCNFGFAFVNMRQSQDPFNEFFAEMAPIEAYRDAIPARTWSCLGPEWTLEAFETPNRSMGGVAMSWRFSRPQMPQVSMSFSAVNVHGLLQGQFNVVIRPNTDH